MTTHTSSPFEANTNSAVVRYQVRDVESVTAFYTEHLGFKVVRQFGVMLAIIARGDLILILSGFDASGSRPMPDGRKQESGGWNRIVLYVESIDSTITTLKDIGTRFRNEIEVGPGGKQILLEDPDGNPIELHEVPQKK